MAQVGSHKTTITNDGNYQKVTYHNTDVVKFNEKEIILNSGGWLTNTTKTRMNQASNQFNLGYNVYQEKKAWYVSLKDVSGNYYSLPFNDGFKIHR
ncbi:MAG: hypothetical protein ACOC2U_03525 [bacterium]